MKLSLQHNLIYSFIEPNSMQHILAQLQALGYNEIASLFRFFSSTPNLPPGITCSQRTGPAHADNPAPGPGQ